MAFNSAISMPQQALTGSPPAELRPTVHGPSAAAPTAAPDSRVLPAPHQTSAAYAGRAGCSACHAAVPGGQPHTGVREAKEGQAAGVSGSPGTGGGGDRLAYPAVGLTGMEASASVAAEHVRLWQGAMVVLQPPDNACTAAVAAKAEDVAGVVERASAARVQAYPLPRRITPAYIRARTEEAVHSLQLTVLEKGCLRSVDSVLAELVRLMAGGEAAVMKAHTAGLGYLASGSGPSLAAGQSCVEYFLDVAASMHDAQTEAMAIALRVPDMAVGFEAENRELEGGRHG